MFRRAIWKHLSFIWARFVWTRASWARRCPFPIHMIYLPFTNGKSVLNTDQNEEEKKLYSHCGCGECVHAKGHRVHRVQGSGETRTRNRNGIEREKDLKYNFAQAIIFYCGNARKANNEKKKCFSCAARLLPISYVWPWDTWEFSNREFTLLRFRLWFWPIQQSTQSQIRMSHAQWILNGFADSYCSRLLVFGNRLSLLIDIFPKVSETRWWRWHRGKTNTKRRRVEKIEEIKMLNANPFDL